MTGSTDDTYTAHAGLVFFPTSPDDLTDSTRCPACFHPLVTTTCDYCGLDLAHPAATELRDLSLDAATALDERVEVIGRIRFESAAAASAAAATAAAAAAAAAAARAAAVSARAFAVPVFTAPVFTAPAFEQPMFAAPDAAAPDAAAPDAAAPVVAAPVAEGRSSVQVLLIVVGVSLVSIAAVFFLVYAFINYGIVWRSVIIAAVTVTAFVVASVLRRRDLDTTAEGIAALAVVLVFLDAFAARANNLFNSENADSLVYWGAVLAIAAIGFAFWHRASGMRIPNVAAFLVFAPGAGLLAAGIIGSHGQIDQVFGFFAAMAFAGTVYPFATRRAVGSEPTPARAESYAALALAAVAIAISFIVAVLPFFDDHAFETCARLLIVAVIAAVHIVVVVRSARAEAYAPFAVVLGGFAGVAISLATLTAIAYSMMTPWSMEPMVGAVVALPLLFALAGRAVHNSVVRASVRSAAAAGAGIAALTLIAPVAVAAWHTVITVVTALAPAWAHTHEPLSTFNDWDLSLILSLAIPVVLFELFTRTTGLLTGVRPLSKWAGAAVVIVTVPLLATTALVSAGWIGIAAVCVAALLAAQRLRPALATSWLGTAGCVALVLGYLASWGSEEVWLAGSIATIILLIAGRCVFSAAANPSASTAVRAGLIGVAAVVAIIASAASARQALLASATDESPSIDPLHAVVVAAIVIVALSSAAVRVPLSTLDRHTLFAIGYPTAVVSIAVSISVLSAASSRSSAFGEPWTNVVLGAAMLAALALWVLPGALDPEAHLDYQLEHAVSAVVLPPALWWLLDSIARAAGLDPTTRTIVPAVAAVFAIAVGLAATAARSSRPTAGTAAASTPLRLIVDIGAAAVGVAALFATYSADAQNLWLSLELGAVATLLLAISPDGLFASLSPRRHLGWLAVALATIGLWWRLGFSSVTEVEAYSLPLAGALAVIAFLLWRSQRAQASDPEVAITRTAPVVPLLLFVALLVAIVPDALASATGTPVRGAIVGGVSAALLLAGSLVHTRAARPYLDGAAGVGLIGLVLVAVGRSIAVTLSGAGHVNFAGLDVWLALAFAVLVVAAFAQAALPHDALPRLVIASVLMVAAMVLIAVFEIAQFSGDYATARAMVTIVVLCAIHVVSTALDRAPLERGVGWTALALAAATAVAAMLSGAVRPIEWATVPVAIALLASGALWLKRYPDARSWPILGWGLGVLLLPSLFATLVDRPLWRLVALGIVAIAVLVVGLVLRLQAPFLIGAAVALVHGFGTFAPEVRAAYELTEWWVWAGAGGILIIVIGARYERSLATARTTVRAIGALR